MVVKIHHILAIIIGTESFGVIPKERDIAFCNFRLNEEIRAEWRGWEISRAQKKKEECKASKKKKRKKEDRFRTLF